MRLTSWAHISVLALGLLASAPTPALAQAPAAVASTSRDHTALARRIVTSTANIKPGEIVVIEGGAHALPLMEALVIEARMVGARTALVLTSDRIERETWTRSPEQYLTQKTPLFAEWIKTVNVYIGLPPVEDPTLFDSLPPARVAAVSKAYADLPTLLNAASLRGVFLPYPSRREAERLKLDSATYATMQWNALAADYGQIAQRARSLAALLGSAKTVRVTTPDGTDFTFSPEGRKIFREDGVVTAEDAKSGAIMERTESLPGGMVSLAPIETSANGRVVVARDVCRGQPLTGVTFELKQGHMQNLKATPGAACITSLLAPYEGPKDRFGVFAIGLNPALSAVETNGAEYRPWSAAGMVSFALGANEFQGGANKTAGGYGFSLTRATVTVDGQVIVRDGRLVPQTASGTPASPGRGP